MYFVNELNVNLKRKLPTDKEEHHKLSLSPFGLVGCSSMKLFACYVIKEKRELLGFLDFLGADGGFSSYW